MQVAWVTAKAGKSIRIIKTSQSQGEQTNTSQSLREVTMRCKLLTSFLLATTVGMPIAGSASAQVTAYEGARVIVGDGRVLDNTTIVVSGGKITQVGGAVPAGATRVNLSGKTVMPLIIDTHTHLSTNRDALVRDLRQRAYFGVGAAMSLGTDNY